jgi:hypothetical protein
MTITEHSEIVHQVQGREPDSVHSTRYGPAMYEMPASLRIYTEGQTTGLSGYKCAAKGLLVPDHRRHSVQPFSVVHVFSEHHPARDQKYDHTFVLA